MTSAMSVQRSNQLSYEVTQLGAGQFVGLMFSRERNVVWKKCYVKCGVSKSNEDMILCCFSIFQIRWIKKCRFINGHSFFFWNFHETTPHFFPRSQNSEYPRIFQVTGANQNARKLLSTDLVNTKRDYPLSKRGRCGKHSRIFRIHFYFYSKQSTYLQLLNNDKLQVSQLHNRIISLLKRFIEYLLNANCNLNFWGLHIYLSLVLTGFTTS